MNIHDLKKWEPIQLEHAMDYNNRSTLKTLNKYRDAYNPKSAGFNTRTGATFIIHKNANDLYEIRALCEYNTVSSLPYTRLIGILNLDELYDFLNDSNICPIFNELKEIEWWF